MTAQTSVGSRTPALAALVAAMLLGGVSPAPGSTPPAHPAGPVAAGGGPVVPAPHDLLSCGTPAVEPAEAAAVQSVLDRWAHEDAAGPPGGVVRVAVHVLTADGEGDVTDGQLAELMRVLDRAFGDGGYRFELARVDRTESRSWFRMAPGSAAEHEAKEALAVEPARHLNLYLCRPAPGPPGWARYPWSAPEGSVLHGVVLDHRSLPGGEAPGRAVAHLVGHYLGVLDGDGPRDATGRLAAGEVARIQSVVPVYRPSLFRDPVLPLAGRSEIVPGAGAEPEEGRVLSYRGAYPNPFRAETALRFTLPASQPVTLRVYSVTGQLVRTVIDATLPPGDHSAIFRAADLPSGAYFAVLRAGSVRMSRTLMLVR